MRHDNILRKLNVPQLNNTVAASSTTDSHMQSDHTQLGKHRNCEWNGVLGFVLKDAAAELWHKTFGKEFQWYSPWVEKASSASLSYIPGYSTTLIHMSPAVMIREWATGVPSWKGGSGIPGKWEQGDLIKHMHRAQLTVGEKMTLQIGRKC